MRILRRLFDFFGSIYFNRVTQADIYFIIFLVSSTSRYLNFFAKENTAKHYVLHFVLHIVLHFCCIIWQFYVHVTIRNKCQISNPSYFQLLKTCYCKNDPVLWIFKYNENFSSMKVSSMKISVPWKSRVKSWKYT